MPLDHGSIELRKRLPRILEQPFQKPAVSQGGRLRSPANANQRRRPSIKNGQIICPLFRAARSFDALGIIAVSLCSWSLGGLSFCVHGNTLSRRPEPVKRPSRGASTLGGIAPPAPTRTLLVYAGVPSVFVHPLSRARLLPTPSPSSLKVPAHIQNQMHRSRSANQRLGRDVPPSVRGEPHDGIVGARLPRGEIDHTGPG